MEAVIADKDRELEKQKKEIQSLQKEKDALNTSTRQDTINYQQEIIELQNALAEEREQCQVQQELAEQHLQTSTSLAAYLADIQVKYGVTDEQPIFSTMPLEDVGESERLVVSDDDDASNPKLHPSPPITPRKARRVSNVSSSGAASLNTSTGMKSSSANNNRSISPASHKKPFTVAKQFHYPIQQGML